ncbi:MAG: penicillin-binding protein 2 [Opitutaceae bacterium]|nr:penicillin-binding protein 2 [Opitutaceae bacterium]
MSEGFISAFRLGIVCVGVLAGFGGFGAKLVHLQVIQRDELVKTVEKARKRVVVLNARRGSILDVHGNLMATSQSFIEVGVDPHSTIEEDATKFPELAALLKVSVEDLVAAFDPETAFRKSKNGKEAKRIRWRKLNETVGEETYDRIRKLGVKGIYGNRSFRRTYPGGSLAAHVLGYVNREGTPTSGVEQYMDFYLRGQDGWRESERDGRRRELAQFRSSEISSVAGYSIILSVDMVVQHIVERELEKIVEEFNPKGATVIVSDPLTGYIMGLANYPSFDLNYYNKADIASQRNIAVTDILEPGSTFKIVVASAVLEESLVTLDTEFNCGSNVIWVKGKALRLPRDSHDHGTMSVSEIVTKSSNRGAAHLGVLLGEDRLYQYARAFGFGEKTQFPFGGEVRGILHPVKKWDGLTITRLPMGHAVSATPMQIHFAMSTIANGGILMKPQIVYQIVNEEGDPVFMNDNGVAVLPFEPRQKRRVISRETAHTMAKLLTDVVAPGGTATGAAIKGFEVAGKTGTTQKIIDGRYSSSHHVGSFSGFFPASSPRVAITVIVDDAQIKGRIAYGSTVAVPSFKVISEQLIQYLGISPTESKKTYASIDGDRYDRLP